MDTKLVRHRAWSSVPTVVAAVLLCACDDGTATAPEGAVVPSHLHDAAVHDHSTDGGALHDHDAGDAAGHEHASDGGTHDHLTTDGAVHDHDAAADGGTHEHTLDAGDGGGGDVLVLAASKQGRSGGFVDFDGDGMLDLLVGAPHALFGGQLGMAQIYAGQGGDAWSSEPVATLRGDRDFGFSFANLGDVDGDAKPEYAVSALHGDAESSALTGSVYVFAGGSHGALLAKLGGDAPASKFGWALAGGDFNGDGVGDIAVGSPFHTPEPALYQAGAVFVFFGPSFSGKVVLAATAANKGLGWSVAAGDVNADGVDDLLLASKPSSGGKVLGYFGGSTFSPALGAPDLTVSSVAGGFGGAIAVLDDLDGDGRRDLAVGAANASVGGLRDVGSVYLVRTPASAAAVALDASPAPAENLARIDGPGLFSRFGATVSALVDADGDGKRELAVGAPLADNQENDMVGKLYLFAGKDLSASTTLTTATALSGTVKFGGFGAFAAASGGSQLLLVGAPRANADTGAVYLVDRTTGAAVQPGVTGDAGSDDHEHDTH